MPPPKRVLQSTIALTTAPPPSLPANQTIARVLSAAGNNLYNVSLPTSPTDGPPTAAANKQLLVELPSRFRSTVWIKRGGYVVVDLTAQEGRENKIGGEVVNVVRGEREWRKMGYWPGEFGKRNDYYGEESDEEEEQSRVGKMPPSDSEED
ncbi:MAG: hypothetical protein M1819_001402 [Sarea resinae]|nr:MAG: hypothetical protein M1819_001402 [Sarea resinae]